MHKMLKICTLFISLFSLPGYATVAINKYMDSPQLVGEARLKVMLWNVFDAKLFSPSGRYESGEPFALSLTYLRSLHGDKIVAKSIEEIRNQGVYGDEGQYAKWQAALGKIIPDVDKGTTLTGVRSAQGHTLFYLGNDRIGEIEDVEFTNAFFSIWLGEKTSNASLRNRLLGVSRTS